MTLRRRVAAAAATAIVLAVALLVLAVPAVLENELQDTLDQSLVRRAADVAQLNATTPDQLTAPGALEGRFSGGTLFVQVIDREGRIVARALELVDARHGLDDRRERRPGVVGRGDRVPEAGDGQVHHAGVHGGEVGVPEPELGHGAGLGVLRHDVEARRQAQDQLAARG